MKKDGSTEDFNRGKLLTSMMSAGATQEQAEEGAKVIEGWMAGQTIAVDTADIRAKVAEYLKTANPTAAQAYLSYRKPG